MRYLLLFIFITISWGEILHIDVPAPEFKLENEELTVTDASYINLPGAPNLPTKTVTIAVPPGAIIEGVNFYGSRIELGSADIPAAYSPLPLISGRGLDDVIRMSNTRKEKYYSTNKIYPEDYGILLTSGGLRKYSLVTVACYHFAYNPITKKLYYSPNIDIEITYRSPGLGSERAKFWEKLKDDVTFDRIAQEKIYNWDDAKLWYHTDTPKRANEYLIIIPTAIVSSVDTLVSYRQSQGYTVNIVTVEHIDSTVAGDDLQQRIRNYLRANMANIEYTLLVGWFTDIPWRNTVPFNNDPDSPWNSPDYSPIPADLYYAELTDHDTISWNYDRDTYFGEVFTESITPPGDDRPDYHADIHLGRIPLSTTSLIENICQKIVRFDQNTDETFKRASLLPGALYYYQNENNSAYPRIDGAEWLEDLINDSILDRDKAVTLYEKAGLRPCTLACTDSLCNMNNVAYWQQKAIMYETHHGNTTLFARKIWAWDDGDSIPENHEFTWPTSLSTSDVPSLDNEYPATAFLRSCLCGKPEVYGLGAQLLNHGSSGIISSSRIAWFTWADVGGIPYHWYDYMLRDTTASRGLFGDAYDIARNDLMDASAFWIIAYHYNLYGDPATKQLGRQIGIEEGLQKTPTPRFAIYPNPTSQSVAIHLQTAVKTNVELDIYDECGRFVQKLYSGQLKGSKKILAKLPAGIYFLRYSDGEVKEFKKFVIVK